MGHFCYVTKDTELSGILVQGREVMKTHGVSILDHHVKLNSIKKNFFKLLWKQTKQKPMVLRHAMISLTQQSSNGLL